MMLKRSKRRKTISSSHSPKISRDPQRSMAMATDISPSNLPPQTTAFQHRGSESFSPYEGTSFSSQDYPEHSTHSTVNPMPQHYPHLPYPHSTDVEWRGSEQASPDQLPVWMTDHSLGGTSFSQHGMDAFIMPTEYVPAAPQIW